MIMKITKKVLKKRRKDLMITFKMAVSKIEGGDFIKPSKKMILLRYLVFLIFLD
jgi:hypothetical protein